IIPLRGKGLWGPIWGYVSLEDDYNTVYGAVFDHKTETPGLGAEINTTWFQKPFKGKNIFNQSGEFVGINIYKGGSGAAANAGDLKHGVDGISGGTITSKGVEAMIHDNLNLYTAYFNKNKN
ncbi:NADH:ubiquinone reductase (Na(+)-transporting) subunit C, partial [Bacteroidota bacterium]